jgi:hypothetical protein
MYKVYTFWHNSNMRRVAFCADYNQALGVFIRQSQIEAAEHLAAGRFSESRDGGLRIEWGDAAVCLVELDGDVEESNP